MKTKIINQQFEFSATPMEVYELLMQEKKHAAFTGEPAHISNRVGGKFTAWGDYITGKNITLEKGKKIVQEWWCGDLPIGHITIVTFLFTAQKSGNTLLEFTQTNVPPEQYEALSQGWIDFYWKPMQQYLSDN